MRLATANLLHGLALTDGLVLRERISEGLGGLGAAVLALQEVDRAQPRSGGLDLTALAATGTGLSAPPAWRFEPALVGTPGESWRAAHDGDRDDLSSPMYGVGLVSALPVRSWHVLRLPAAPVRSPVLIPGLRRPLLLADEPRVALAAVIQTPAGEVTVASTHLSFVPGWNGAQLRRVLAFLRALPAPRYLLGDLNLPGALPRVIGGWRQLARIPTYPSSRPRVQLDHVLGSGPVPSVLGSGAVKLQFSDHRALWVELAEPPPGLR